MANLAAETKEMGFQLEQVQDFTPTPMTVATVIYYSGVHPYTLKPTFAPKTKQEKKDQHRFFFWYKPENKQWVKDKLNNAGQPELLERLIGSKRKSESREMPKWLKEKREQKHKRRPKKRR